ncbi:MAG: ATP-binding protein [Candidatus Zixiibacteriota bacterium]
MSQGHEVRTVSSSSTAVYPEWREIEKRLFALESLSRLTEEFASRPDFERLTQFLLLTIAGQFSIGSACLVLRETSDAGTEHLYYGTGRLRECRALAEAGRTAMCEGWLDGIPYVVSVDDSPCQDGFEALTEVLRDHGVRLIAPLHCNGRLLGFIGLAGKVNGTALSEPEQSLLGVLITTTAPLIANSLLFLEVTHLSASHLAILNTVPQGVFVFEQGERLSRINAAGVEILNELTAESRRHDELLGLSIDEVFSESTFPAWGPALKSPLAHEEGSPIQRLVAGNGPVERTFNLRRSAISHGLAMKPELVVTLEDVTTARDQENRLFELEKHAEKGVMISTIAHELNNYLGLITGGLELAQLSLRESDPVRTTRFVEQLVGNVANMQRFAAGLMDSVTLAPQKRKVSLNTIIADLVAFTAIQSRFRGLRIDTSLGQNLPAVDLDPDLITQVLMNLLNNAADAIAETRRGSGTIRVTTMRADDGIELRVADDGAGMTPEVAQNLFRSRLTTKAKGHGHGLMTCANIIQSHGGTVTVESQPEVGSTFIIRLTC